MGTNPVVFNAVLLQNQSMDAAYVEFPYNPMDVFGRNNSIRVKVVFDGSTMYRGSLVKMGHTCHILGVTKDIRKKLGKTFGDTIHVSIEQDLAERIVELPEDLTRLLHNNQKALAFFNTLSYTNQKEYITWITSARKHETRQKRVESFLDKLQRHQKLSDT